METTKESYQGSCHCGEVTFSIKTDLGYSVVCDCSMCIRRGAKMVRCDEEDLVIITGEANLTKYQFNTMIAEHYFCKKCGIYTFHRMRKLPKKFGVNSGCLLGVDPFALEPILTEGSKR